jgi:hypothetical protein
LGLLSLRWALIDHVITNCLKVLMNLGDGEAIDRVFPLYATQKMDEIKQLIKSRNLSAEGDRAYRAFLAKKTPTTIPGRCLRGPLYRNV